MMGNSKSAQVEPVADDVKNEEIYGQPFQYEANFDGPFKKRSCTDVVCLLLFLAFLGGWGFVAYVGVTTGNINKVRKICSLCVLLFIVDEHRALFELINFQYMSTKKLLNKKKVRLEL